MQRIRPLLTAALLLAGLGVAGCANPPAPGAAAAEARFPDAASAVLKEGTFPHIDELRSIGPGATRDQLYQALGRPHFHEGFRAREWDYLFHFRQGDGSVMTCQYKVVFDADLRGRAFHWLPARCAELLHAAGRGRPDAR